MRETFEILQSLGGKGTVKQIRNLARQRGIKVLTVTADLRALRQWRMVEASPYRPGVRMDDTVWFLTGEQMSWNVIHASPEVRNSG